MIQQYYGKEILDAWHSWDLKGKPPSEPIRCKITTNCYLVSCSIFLDEVHFNRRIINVTVPSMAIYSKVLLYMSVYTYTYIKTGPNRPDKRESQ